MKLAELTIEQMSRWCAEKNEPNFYAWRRDQRSPLGFWTWARKPDAPTGHAEPTLITEPEIAMRLLKALMAIPVDNGNADDLWREVIGQMNQQNISLEIAIAQAYMLANGWEEER